MPYDQYALGDRIQPILTFFPWMKTFNRLIQEAKIPTFSGTTLYITSDYSGDNRESLYSVVSILIADLDNSVRWNHLRSSVRQQYLADGRRMAFKNLNDRQRQKALAPFLKSANSIEGLCLTIAIDKRIKNMCLDTEIIKLLPSRLALQARWQHSSFSQMLHIVQFIALLIGALSKPKQNVYWISDEDQIFANTVQSADVAKVLSIFSGLFVQHELGVLGVGTTKLDEGDRFEEDLAAIPDLAAGTVAEIITTLGTLED